MIDKLEAVSICVGYDDFLLKTLPLNRPHVDRLVVVTRPEDERTIEVCSRYDTECVTTHAFGPNGGFCKGAGINVGLSELDLDGWVLHLDADTVLPIYARDLLNRRKLDPTCIYGADRINAVGQQALATHVSERRMQGPPRTFGTEGWWLNTIRVVFYEFGGWLPCGFFQLWNPGGSGVKKYPEDRVFAEPAHAGNTDLLFAGKNWEQDQRILMPEILLCHVESRQEGSGRNWYGRKTPRLDEEEELDASHHGHGPPRNTHPPTITAPASYGDSPPRVGETLTMTTGTWEGYQPITLKSSWRRSLTPNGREFRAIPGATKLSYVVTREDVGLELRARVDAHNERGKSAAHSWSTKLVVS